jgi:hypothetical protein
MSLEDRRVWPYAADLASTLLMSTPSHEMVQRLADIKAPAKVFREGGLAAAVLRQQRDDLTLAMLSERRVNADSWQRILEKSHFDCNFADTSLVRLPAVSDSRTRGLQFDERKVVVDVENADSRMRAAEDVPCSVPLTSIGRCGRNAAAIAVPTVR